MSGIILVFLILFVLQVATGSWWWVFVVPFFCGAFRSKTALACVRSSGLGAGLLWLIGAVFTLLTDGGRIASQVAQMGGLDSPLVTVGLSALVAGLAGGVSGLAGFQMKRLLKKTVSFQEHRDTTSSQRRIKTHDRGRAPGEDQEARRAPIAGGASRSRPD